VCQKIAPRQSGLAAFYGFEKAVFFLELPGDEILHPLVEVAALLPGTLREAGFEVSVEMNFHGSWS
jgi:hypothetical protein